MKYRFLIVDDDPDILSLLENILWDKYELICIRDSREILDNIEDYEPDLCIIDIMMPGIDGRDLVKLLRAKALFAKIPIIFLSVLNERQIIIDAYKSGGDLFLTKPFTPKRFLNSLHEFMKRKVIPIKQKRYSINELNTKQHNKYETLAERRAASKTPLPVERGKTKTPFPDDSSSVLHVPPSPIAPHISFEQSKTEPIWGKAAEPPGPPTGEKSAPQMPRKPSRKICKIPRILAGINDQDLLELLNAFLGKKYELFSVKNGVDLLRDADFMEPDLFIIDPLIPLLSGYQICHMLRQSDFFFSTPIIMISEITSKKDVEYAKRLGVTVFLPKPFEFPELEYIISSIVQAPDFSVRPKFHLCEEIRNRKELEQERLEGKVHRETKNTMRDFIRQHSDYKK